MTSAGWYGDPGDPTRVRYWDGTAWTAHVHPPAPPPPPLNAGRPVVVVPLAEPDPASEREDVLSDITARRLAAFVPAAAGAVWGEDPLDRLQARWWDGARWTGRVTSRPLDALEAGPATPVDKGDLGREGVHWPSPREHRFLDRCAPASSGWYYDPLAPGFRGRFWDGAWTEQVRPRRDVVLDQALALGAAPGYGDPEDIARTRRSLTSWTAVGAFFVLAGLAVLVDPRGQHSLAPMILGVAGLARAWVMRTKLRGLGQL